MRVESSETRLLGTAPGRDGPASKIMRPVGRFAMHLAEMCAVMCAGAAVLSVGFFGAAAQLGYTDLPNRAPALSVFVIAVNLSLPMAVWMRFRGMQWRPTLEMASSTMVVGLALIAAYWTGLVAGGSLIEIQTSLACPVMVAVMLARFPLYARSHRTHQAQAG